MKIIPFTFPEELTELELYPLNDLHIGDPKTDLPLFRKFINHIKEKPNRTIVCVGDLINNAIKTSVSNVYNETMPPNEQRKFIVEELRPIKDRILCFVSGNHEYRSKKDVDLDPVEWMADKLGIEHYSEDEMAIKISFGKNEHSKPITYGIYLTHGNGGGKRPGSALNNLELLALTLENVDVIIIGHIHKRIGYRFTCRSFDYQNKRLTPVEKLCVVSSSWQDFNGGYAARKMLIPGCKGAEPIILSGKEKRARAVI